MRLGRISDQSEGPAGTQLQVRHLDTPINTTHDQTLFTPVKLEGLATRERQGDEG
jgi:hypothetical protein